MRSIRDLDRTGAFARRASPYVEFSGRHDDETGVDPVQPWLFEEMTNANWHTGLKPYQQERLPAGPYPYPGQSGKRLVYAGDDSEKVVYCR